MIDFAREHFVPDHANLSFAIGDATRLTYQDAFDPWSRSTRAALGGGPEHGAAMHSRRAASDGQRPAAVRGGGERKSLEDVIEETRKHLRWSRHFAGFRQPYPHLPPAEYRRPGGACEFPGRSRVDVALEAWDFGSRGSLRRIFGDVTFVEWTRRSRRTRRTAFIADVLDRYQRLGDGSAADAAIFHSIR
jgi:trans-aconitate 2-methyltransferase